MGFNEIRFFLMVICLFTQVLTNGQIPKIEIESADNTDSSAVMVIYGDNGSFGNTIIGYSNNTGFKNAPITYSRGIVSGYDITWKNYGLWGHFYAPVPADPGQGGLFSYGMDPLDPQKYVSLANENSAIQIVDGNQQSGYILTSDSLGHASWQAPSTGTSPWSEVSNTIYYNSGPVGIGTSSISTGSLLDINGGSISVIDSNAYFKANANNSVGKSGLIMQNNDANSGWIYYDHSSARLILSNNTTGNSHLTLDTTGKVGINASTPDEQLEVNGKIKLSEAGNNQEMVIINGDIWSHANGDQDFGDGGNPFIMASFEGSSESAGIYGDGDHLTLWSAGDAPPGLSDPAYLFILDEDAFDNDGNPFNDNSIVVFLDDMGIWQSSDQRIKQDISPLSSTLDKLQQVNAYQYRFNRTNSKSKSSISAPGYGFMAQELREIFPAAVSVNDYGQHFVNYTMMIPVLAEALKESNDEVKALKSTVEKQQKLLDELLERVEALE